MYFGHVFGWNVVSLSLNAAINNMSVIFILKTIKNSWNKKALNDDQKFLSEQESTEKPETQINQ